MISHASTLWSPRVTEVEFVCWTNQACHCYCFILRFFWNCWSGVKTSSAFEIWAGKNEREAIIVICIAVRLLRYEADKGPAAERNPIKNWVTPPPATQSHQFVQNGVFTWHGSPSLQKLDLRQSRYTKHTMLPTSHNYNAKAAASSAVHLWNYKNLILWRVPKWQREAKAVSAAFVFAWSTLWLWQVPKNNGRGPVQLFIINILL